MTVTRVFADGSAGDGAAARSARQRRRARRRRESRTTAGSRRRGLFVVGLGCIGLGALFDVSVRLPLGFGLREDLRDRRVGFAVLGAAAATAAARPLRPPPRLPRARRAPPPAAAPRPRALRASSPRRRTSVKSSIGIEKRPIRLSGSVAIFRRSTRTFRARQISSAMSDGVTEPKSDPVGPALTSNRSTVLPRSSAISCACSAVLASCFARSASTLRSSATRAGVAFSASRRGRR